MGKNKGFTLQLLKRFERENRGIGILQDYVPYHQVRRGEPSSRGRSGLYIINGRQVHLLSTGEFVAALMASMHPALFDLREQFPLQLQPSPHELHAYTNTFGKFFPGTVEIAQALGIDHPKLLKQHLWRMTTDLLITLKVDGKYRLLAIACKPAIPTKSREIELLLIEKKYWEFRGVEWLLITPELYKDSFATTLRAYSAHVLNTGDKADQSLISSMNNFIRNRSYCSFSDLFKHFVSKGNEPATVQTAFWFGFWFGSIPMEIKYKFDPKRQIKLLTPDDFKFQNPILSGRSS